MNEGEGRRRRFEVVLNRASGTLRELWHEGLPQELEEVFAGAGVEARVRPAAPPELDRAIDEALGRRPDAVVVGGGDGTVAGAATKMVGGGVPLGILPFGTFNLAARDLGLPLEAMAAARALASADELAIDVLELGGRICLCTSLAGFYPAMAQREEEYHGRAWWRKTLRIVRETFRVFHRSPPLGLSFDTEEGERLLRATRFAALVPGEYEDVLSVIPKRRGLRDGRMTVYLSRHASLGSFLRGALAFLLGRLRSERDLEVLRTRGLRIEARRRRHLLMMIDGEILRLPLPLDVRVRPRALRVLRPCGEPEGGGS